MFVFFFILFPIFDCEKHLTKTKKKGEAFIVETFNRLPIETDNDALESGEYYLDNFEKDPLDKKKCPLNKKGCIKKKTVKKNKKTQWIHPETDMEKHPKPKSPHNWINKPDVIPPSGWKSRCSHKTAGPSWKHSGEKIVREVYGCGASIAITCTGGCIRIHKALFDCVASSGKWQEVNKQHLHLTKTKCEGKERCFLQPSEKFYGRVAGCQKKDDLSTLWLTYSCDRGTHSEELNNQCQDPIDLPTWDPTDPPTWDPTDPPTWDPTDPPTWDPTDPPTWDPTDPPIWDPTDPPAWDPSNPLQLPTWKGRGHNSHKGVKRHR